MSTQVEVSTDRPGNLSSDVRRPTGHDEKRFIKVSGIGPDQPGIVYKVARVIRKNAGNIYLQRSMQVAGDFALTLIASFGAENSGGLRNVLAAFGQDALGDDFKLFAREIDMNSFARQNEGGAKYVVTIAGDDQAGIVESMALILFQNNLNLIFFESEVAYRPFQGTPTFSAMFEIAVPDGFDMETFSAELEQFEKNTDLTILVRKQ